MFKKLVQMISEMDGQLDGLAVMDKINKAFEAGKISWKDHELLIDIASYYGVGKDSQKGA